MVLKLDCKPESPGELVKTKIAGPHFPEFMIQQLWDRLKVCISNWFPDDGNIAGFGTTL